MNFDLILLWGARFLIPLCVFWILVRLQGNSSPKQENKDTKKGANSPTSKKNKGKKKGNANSTTNINKDNTITKDENCNIELDSTCATTTKESDCIGDGKLDTISDEQSTSKGSETGSDSSTDLNDSNPQESPADNLPNLSNSSAVTVNMNNMNMPGSNYNSNINSATAYGNSPNTNTSNTGLATANNYNNVNNNVTSNSNLAVLQTPRKRNNLRENGSPGSIHTNRTPIHIGNQPGKDV